MTSCIAFLTLPLFVKSSYVDDPEYGKKRILEYIYIQNFSLTLVSVLQLIFIRDKPPTPPSDAFLFIDIDKEEKINYM